MTLAGHLVMMWMSLEDVKRFRAKERLVATGDRGLTVETARDFEDTDMKVITGYIAAIVSRHTCVADSFS